MPTKEKKYDYRDGKAPSSLQLIIADSNGNEWGRLYALPREFTTGSVGFNVIGKVSNSANPEARYQAGCNFTLINSGPKKKEE